MYELTGHYIEVCGIRTYYEQAGCGRPVVCLAMAGASGSQLYRITQPLASDKYCFIAPDLPGRGKTLPNIDTLRPIEDTGEYLDFIWKFIQALKLEKPILFGAAMTANAVMLLAAEHPDEVSAVIAVGGGLTPKAELDLTYEDMLDHPGVNLSDFKETHLIGMLGPDLPRQRINECIWYAAKTQVSSTARADSMVFRGLGTIGRLQNLNEIPVLMIRGDCDVSIPEQARSEILSLKRMEERVVHGAGHYAVLEKPEEISREVGAFLERTFG